MANKLLNVRMDQEMIEDLKKVCGELEISVTDAIKLFSNKLIKERTLPIEEKKEVYEDIIDTEEKNTKLLQMISEAIEDSKETSLNKEKYIQLHNDFSEILSFYCKQFGNLIYSTTHYTEFDGINAKSRFIVSFDTPFSEIEKTFKEKYEEELKNKILNKMTEFYSEYYKELEKKAEEEEKQIKEHQKKMKAVENDKYIDVMENLKTENPNLYKELLNKYSYNINYYDVDSLDCESYSDAKKKLEEFLTPEEIKEYYTFYSEIDNCKTEEEKEKLIENIKKDENRTKILKSAFEKYKEYNEKKYPEILKSYKNSKEQEETKDE